MTVPSPRRSAIAVLLSPLLLVAAGAAPMLMADPAPSPASAAETAPTASSDPDLAPVLAPDPAVATAVDAALEALAPRVAVSSHDGALEMAFRAYFRHRAEHPDEVKKPYLYYVDFGLDNRTPRGYVFDMDDLSVVEGPFTVSHGVGSSNSRNGVPVRFSNRPGSKMTSLGLYLAQETYTFRGRSGGRAYSSVGLRMQGESGEFNDAARRRGIVAHGAPYVTAGDAGRSEGCPAMEQRLARRLLPMIANGGMVFIFSPNDQRWLDRDPWAGQAAGSRVAGVPAETD